MAKMLRYLLLVGICSTGFAQLAIAQSDGGIPSEVLLNRYGLTLAWSVRSTIDGSRDTVLHASADEQNVYIQSNSGIVTTFNGESGRQLWSILVGAPDQRGYPAVSNDEEVLIAAGMQIYSFNKDTGNLIWQLRSPEHPSSSPVLNDDQLAFGTIDGSVFAFDLRKVRQLHQEQMLPQWSHLARQWRYKAPLRIVSPPILSGTTIVFASERGIVYGLSALNKNFKFQFETDATIHTALGSSREFILVVDDDSRMYCLNKETGRTRWTFASGAPIQRQPRVVGQQVFVAPQREGLISLTLVSGRMLWTQPQAIEFIAASETRVYASDISGNLLIMERENGEIIGQIPLRKFNVRIPNERTDRIFMADDSGLVIGIQEVNSEFPAFHRFPERQPILPILAEEDAETPAEGDDSDNSNPLGN